MTTYLITFKQIVQEECELILDAESKDEALELFLSGQAYGNGYDVIDSQPNESYDVEIRELE